MTREALVFALLMLVAQHAYAEDRVIPDPSLTPGVTRSLTVEQVCSTKWGRDERSVTEAMKTQVFAAYGIPSSARHLPNGKPAFEIDHLVSRELAGADDVKNLWPEPYTGPWNAHLKDRVENRLHVEVCANRMTLDEAQQAIRTDWRIPYRKFFGEPPQ